MPWNGSPASRGIRTPVAESLGNAVGNAISGFGGADVANIARGWVSGVITETAVRASNGGSIKWQNIAADAFGNALGQSLGEGLAGRTESEIRLAATPQSSGSQDRPDSYWSTAAERLEVGRARTVDTTDAIEDIIAEQNRIRHVGEDATMREGLRADIERYNALRIGAAADRGLSLAPAVENAARLGLISSDALLDGLASTTETYPLRAEPPIIARDLQPESVAARGGYAPGVDQRYYVAPGFIASSYSQALSMMRGESLSERGVGLAGATAMLPMMLLEEAGRAVLNVPYQGAQAGQNAAQFVTAASTDERVVAGLSLVSNVSAGIVGAGVLVPGAVSIRGPAPMTQAELRAVQASFALDTTAVDAEMAGFTNASQAMIRERVLSNVAQTRAGNASSNFNTFFRNEGRLEEALDIWPPNRGQLGPVEVVELQPGFIIDRFGLPRGHFVSPEGTTFAERSLPSSYEATKPYFQYEVVQTLPDAIQSYALPWFGQRGLGLQFELPKPVQWYLDNGYLRVRGR